MFSAKCGTAEKIYQLIIPSSNWRYSCVSDCSGILFFGGGNVEAEKRYSGKHGPLVLRRNLAAGKQRDTPKQLSVFSNISKLNFF